MGKCSTMIFTHNFFSSWLMFLIDVYQAKYYAEEVKDKSKKDIDVSNWEREFVEDLPEQQNGCVFFFLSVLLLESSARYFLCYQL